MAENSKIEWTHHTANLWWGCTKVHAGCDHCYAETLSHRWGFDVWGNDKPRREVKSVWKDLNRYQKQAAAAGEVHRVFVGSMMDIFEKPFPVISLNGESGWLNTAELRMKLFSLIDSGAFPNLMFLLLTKRPSNINKMIPPAWKENPPKNVMFGCSPVNQETSDKLIPQLLQVNGKKFLSIEPQLGEIYLDRRYLFEWCPEHDMPSGGCTHSQHKDKSQFTKIDWIICGGESGAGRRPFNPEWARLLSVQCGIAKVPFFMKQIDKVIPIPEDLMIRQFPYSFDDYEIKYGEVQPLHSKNDE